MKMLKRTRPNIDFWGTIDNKTWKTLYVLFIFTFFFYPLNKNKYILSKSMLKP